MNLLNTYRIILAASNTFQQKEDNCPIKLIKAEFTDEYIKKWNIDTRLNYCHLYKDGVKMSDTLYRQGSFEANLNDKYFQLIKYKEAYYDKSITSITKSDPKHLGGTWCILNQDCKEIVESPDSFKHLSILGDIVYSIDKKYYDIETHEYLGSPSSILKSKDFLFFDNTYEKDESLKGILKISKKDCTFELFKIK